MQKEVGYDKKECIASRAFEFPRNAHIMTSVSNIMRTFGARGVP